MCGIKEKKKTFTKGDLLKTETTTGSPVFHLLLFLLALVSFTKLFLSVFPESQTESLGCDSKCLQLENYDFLFFPELNSQDLQTSTWQHLSLIYNATYETLTMITSNRLGPVLAFCSSVSLTVGRSSKLE